MNEEAERFELQELTRDQLWHIEWFVGLLVFSVIMIILEWI